MHVLTNPFSTCVLQIIHLKKAFQQSGLTKKKMKELVIRSLYVEMLGQDASFAYIRGVELCASTAITQKKVGYLAASLCLSPQHEFRFMLVNQIQRDMKRLVSLYSPLTFLTVFLTVYSTNLLEICAALTAISKIVTEDMIPAVITDVSELNYHLRLLLFSVYLALLSRWRIFSSMIWN